ncbi:uncharacterized protein LOC141531846 [Cotesia typhae]|uniref:uncharacterized protein LOC141531846 n=1 Tax=Cotesia typhae TaxID=2053667 RepID=UPI003D69F405
MMKMEVVLSPGRFGDDGTPFKNEEIREWSRIDRLTGMLERARIETGRWKTKNDDAARSYGKVTDQRERNSVDGSVTQKAHRQVEIFQSKEPGRSVQVVRASQWSSSKVTDVIESILPPSDRLSRLEELKIDNWKLPSLRDIHAELERDTELPGIKNTINNDDIFKKCTLIKRSNSDDDLSILSAGGSSKNADSFTRDCKNRRSLQISPSVISISSSSSDERKNISSGIYSPLSSATTGNTSVIIGDKSNYGSLRKPSIQSSPRTNRPAVTVVNLINPDKYKDDPRNKKSIVTLRSSPITEEEDIKTFDNNLSVKNKTNSFGDETLPGRIKKVGFCKTEIHFAADSGKVNIVETDGKPPPTNRFRRRKRNHNYSSGQGSYPRRMIIKENPPDVKHNKILDDTGAYSVVDLETKKFWTPERDGKIHTTMINVRDNEELKKSKELSSPKVVSEVISRRNIDQVDNNIVTKDADNNRVLSTIVTTHESTIARVEDNVPKIKKPADDFNRFTSSLLRRNKSSGLKRASSVKSDTSKNSLTKRFSKEKEKIKDPVYINVFRGNRTPIYENYEPPEKSASESEPATAKSSVDKKNSFKISNKLGKRSPVTTTRFATWSGSIGKYPRDLTKAKVIKKINYSNSNNVSNSSTDTSKFQRKSSPTNESKRSDIKTGSRAKKPMEVIYRTAVYNMKNEKLSKPTKGRDTKTPPRYINDLICGNRTSHPSNSKHKGSISQTNKEIQTSHWK